MNLRTHTIEKRKERKKGNNQHVGWGALLFLKKIAYFTTKWANVSLLIRIYLKSSE